MKLVIPKALVISNFKINLVYSAALLSSVGGLVAYIVEQRAYLTPLNLQTQLAISALPGKGSRPLCAPSPAGPCWYSEEAVVQESSKCLFIATSLKEGSAQLSYAVPNASSVEVSFRRFFHVAPDTLVAAEEIAQIVVLGDHGQHWRQMGAKEDLVLSLAEITSLAQGEGGSVGTLDGESGLPEGLTNNGGTIAVTLDCKSKACFVSFSWRLSSSQRVIRSGSSSAPALLLFRGVRLEVETGVAATHYFDPVFLMSLASTVLVCVHVVQAIVTYGVLYLLGEVSAIYRRAAWNVFNIVSAATETSARMLTYAVVYAELAALDVDDDVDDGIAREVLGERLQKILEFEGNSVSSDEVDAFISFVHAGLLRKASKGTVDEKHDFRTLIEDSVQNSRRELGMTGMSTLNKAPMRRITIDMFVNACAANDEISYPNIVRLFDRDRPRSSLERIFTPADVNAVLGRKRSADSRPAEVDQKAPPRLSLEARKRMHHQASQLLLDRDSGVFLMAGPQEKKSGFTPESSQELERESVRPGDTVAGLQEGLNAAYERLADLEQQLKVMLSSERSPDPVGGLQEGLVAAYERLGSLEQRLQVMLPSESSPDPVGGLQEGLAAAYERLGALEQQLTVMRPRRSPLLWRSLLRPDVTVPVADNGGGRGEEQDDIPRSHSARVGRDLGGGSPLTEVFGKAAMDGEMEGEAWPRAAPSEDGQALPTDYTTSSISEDFVELWRQEHDPYTLSDF